MARLAKVIVHDPLRARKMRLTVNHESLYSVLEQLRQTRGAGVPPTISDALDELARRSGSAAAVRRRS
jgi:hypothetical protein